MEGMIIITLLPHLLDEGYEIENEVVSLVQLWVLKDHLKLVGLI